jgi:hypothetical protein
MTAAALLGVAALALPAACGSRSGGSTVTGGQRVTVTWHDKGRTVSVTAGTPLVLRLNNVAWEIRGSSNSDVVRQTGAVRHKPAPPGTCPAGVGCGRVIARFRAVGPGTAHLRASRSSCGEVLRCTRGRGRYDVTIRVS